MFNAAFIAVVATEEIQSLLLVAAGAIWLIFGTFTIRRSVAMLNSLIAPGNSPKPAAPRYEGVVASRPGIDDAAEKSRVAEEQLKIPAPAIPAAIWMVIVNAILLGIAGVMIRS